MSSGLSESPTDTNQFIRESVKYIKIKHAENVSTMVQTNTRSIMHACSQPQRQNQVSAISHLINHRLYKKYSSSQNYYYMKDVNAIITKSRIPSVIFYKDLEDYLKSEEIMRRFYYIEEYWPKFQQLTEYYKFHREIPRIFSKAEYDIYFEYHDRKRKVEFVRITNMLKMENGEDPYLEKKLELVRIRNKRYEPMLDGLSSFVRSEYHRSASSQPRRSSNSNKSIIVHEGVRNELRFAGGFHGAQREIKRKDRRPNLNQSSTLYDIYDKLNEIISSSSIMYSLGHSTPRKAESSNYGDSVNLLSFDNSQFDSMLMMKKKVKERKSFLKKRSREEPIFARESAEFRKKSGPGKNKFLTFEDVIRNRNLMMQRSVELNLDDHREKTANDWSRKKCNNGDKESGGKSKNKNKGLKSSRKAGSRIKKKKRKRESHGSMGSHGTDRLGKVSIGKNFDKQVITKKKLKNEYKGSHSRKSHPKTKKGLLKYNMAHKKSLKVSTTKKFMDSGEFDAKGINNELTKNSVGQGLSSGRKHVNSFKNNGSKNNTITSNKGLKSYLRKAEEREKMRKNSKIFKKIQEKFSRTQDGRSAASPLRTNRTGGLKTSQVNSGGSGGHKSRNRGLDNSGKASKKIKNFSDRNKKSTSKGYSKGITKYSHRRGDSKKHPFFSDRSKDRDPLQHYHQKKKSSLSKYKGSKVLSSLKYENSTLNLTSKALEHSSRQDITKASSTTNYIKKRKKTESIDLTSQTKRSGGHPLNIKNAKSTTTLSNHQRITSGKLRENNSGDLITGAKGSKKSFHQQHKSIKERSLDRFREELKQLKYNTSGSKGSFRPGHKPSKSINSLRGTKKGHYKTRSDLSLGLAYFTKYEPKRGQGGTTGPHHGHHQSSSSNYLKIRKKSGGQLDFDYLAKKNNLMGKKSVEKTAKDIRRIQFENIYKTRFSNLKQELKAFKTQKKTKVLDFESQLGKFSSSSRARKQQKYLKSKQNKNRVGSLNEMNLIKFVAGAKTGDKEPKFFTKKSGGSKVAGATGGKSSKLFKRGKHKYTRSEPEKLMGLRFLKKKEGKGGLGMSGRGEGSAGMHIRRESQPFNSHRGAKKTYDRYIDNIIHSSRNQY